MSNTFDDNLDQLASGYVNQREKDIQSLVVQYRNWVRGELDEHDRIILECKGLVPKNFRKAQERYAEARAKRSQTNYGELLQEAMKNGRGFVLPAEMDEETAKAVLEFEIASQELDRLRPAMQRHTHKREVAPRDAKPFPFQNGMAF